MNEVYSATAKQEKELIAELLIEPGQTKTVSLGIYETGIPQPDIHIKYGTESHAEIEARVQRQDFLGEYSLETMLQNTTDEPNTVSLWLTYR